MLFASLAISGLTLCLSLQLAFTATTNNIVLDTNLRLPNLTEPLHYKLMLTTNVHTGNKTFEGLIKIDLKVNEDTREIVLHSLGHSDIVATARLTGNALSTEQEMLVHYEKKSQFLTLKLKQNQLHFTANSCWTVSIKYSGELRTDMSGFYLSSYADENNNKRYLAATQFSGTSARHAFPCYDEPAKRANFTITIKHDSKYHAISNMPVDELKSKPGITAFLTSVKMPTYLVAFIVSDFVWSEGTRNSLKQRVYSHPGTEREQAWALTNGMLFIEHLSEYFALKYALPKLDEVAVPDLAPAAMENWGLVTYKERYLLYNPQKSSTAAQLAITKVIAHEYTHQWFGNLVTFAWWNYLWLAEGFAMLFEYGATDEVYPDWDIYQKFHTEAYQNALNEDVKNISQPMSTEDAPTVVVYYKAASVLHMFQHALTAAVFQQGLRYYLQENQYGAAEEAQLFSALDKAVQQSNYGIPASIEQMMSTWTQQSGYPLLTVTRNYNNGTFHLEQQSYHEDNTQKRDKLWYVPFNYAFASQPDFRETAATHYLLNESQIYVYEALLHSNDWLLLNKQSTGYYRINYDERNWHLIIQTLISNPLKIHLRNRAQLLDDAYHLARTDRLKPSILFQLLSYLRQEEQYAPWQTAYNILQYLQKQLQNEWEHALFNRFLFNLVENIYNKLGADALPEEPKLQRLTRPLIIDLACTAGIESCLAMVQTKFQQFTMHGTPIEADVQHKILCHGLKELKEDNEKEFAQLLNNSLYTKDIELRAALLTAMSCTKSQNQLEKLLESSLDISNNFDKDERIQLLTNVCTTDEKTQELCFDFLQCNTKGYAYQMDNKTEEQDILIGLLENMSAVVMDSKQANQLLKLLQQMKGDYKKLQKTIQANIKESLNMNKKRKDWIVAELKNYQK